ncbi:MAG: glycosyltransferase, partial [Actinomycetes bacterium]
MEPAVATWFARRSSRAADWPLDTLLTAKGSTTVSVVLPALDEASTVGAIVDAVRRDLVDVGDPLVDELVVLDSGSTDATARVAADAGARVVHRDDVLPDVPSVAGKGEALWRSLATTTGDVVVFI